MGTKVRGFALAFGLCIAACGGKTGGEEESISPGSGIERSKRVNALTEAERATLCDFAIARLGGYGTFRNCGNNLGFRTPKDQKACVATSKKPCEATVGDVESCSEQLSCENLFPSACSPLLSCAFVSN
jgi:hypothetical protein